MEPLLDLPPLEAPDADVPVSGRPRRPELEGVRRVVVKLGTRVLIDDEGRPRIDRLEALADSVLSLRRTAREVIVVTSGAVGLGRGLLGFTDLPRTVEDRRACAAVGQGALQALYRDAFTGHDLLTAQVLLTGQDFTKRRHPHLRATFERLLASGVVLIVNENDAVTLGAVWGRPVFHDNDGLAALVAGGCAADLLVLLTDVAGVYERDPRRFPGHEPIPRLDDPVAFLPLLGPVDTGSEVSRGGMRSKVEAAASAARSGCRTVIASGDEPAVVERILDGELLGTYVPENAGALPRNDETGASR